MPDFWDSSVWGFISVVATLLLSILIANAMKRLIRPLRVSLIPTPVLAGFLILAVSLIYEAVAGFNFFDTMPFGGKGTEHLETITYHTLALGFIATAYVPSKKKREAGRGAEIFNAGVTTVSTYLLQGILGIAVTLIFAAFTVGMFGGAGVILPFGFGQGTGQAMNYGNIFQDAGFAEGKSFGLSIAALGFASASIGGVVHLNILRHRHKGKYDIDATAEDDCHVDPDDVHNSHDIALAGSVDKLTVQLGFVIGTYFVVYGIMYVLGSVAPGMLTTIFGFNFLIGVLLATLVGVIHNKLLKKNVLKKCCVNGFLMTRLSGFFFDIMVISGIAAIRLEALQRYWPVLLALTVVGIFSTYYYNHFVAKKLYPKYTEEQFLAMYGMLTGTAGTGMILVRAIDKDLKTPAADNLVYQNLSAIVFGLPMMFIAPHAVEHPWIVLGIVSAYFVALNILLFRSYLFPALRKKRLEREAADAAARAENAPCQEATPALSAAGAPEEN